jgi:hypothetical protein
MACDQEYLSQRARDYLVALQKKVNNNAAALKDIQDGFDSLREKLDFFNKRQTKFDPKEGFDTSDKVGQGIAATSKRLNLVFGAYARAMLDRIKEIILRNKRDIILATHDSEAGLNDLFTALMDKCARKMHRRRNWCCNDFSEWDASFRACFAALTHQLMLWMGCPQDVADWFLQFRSDWTMVYQHSYGTTTLRGQEKQFSGNPFTICENTIGNMALCFYCFRYRNMRLALFKGDDSAVLCDNSTLTQKGKRLLELTGHGLKLHNTPIGEFAGWFLTDEGLFPDVLRYSAKFLDKPYRDQQHFDEAQQCLQERCAAVKTQSQRNLGIATCAEYYQNLLGRDDQNGTLCVSYGDMEILFDFLYHSRQIKFSELTRVQLPLIHV